MRDWQETGDWLEVEDEGFIALVGPIYSGETTAETARFRFVAQDKHRNLRGVVQGGMIMTFADRSMGLTARRGNPRVRTATVQLDVHFIDAIQIGESTEILCRVLSRTRSLIFMDGTLTVGGRLVATARGTWKLLKPLPEGEGEGEGETPAG